MDVLEDYSLKEVEGGFGIWAVLGIAVILVFLVGVVDGFVRPLKCN